MYLSNGLPESSLVDRMLLCQWFDLFQITFNEKVLTGPIVLPQLLHNMEQTHDYEHAMELYSRCLVKRGSPIPGQDDAQLIG